MEIENSAEEEWECKTFKQYGNLTPPPQKKVVMTSCQSKSMWQLPGAIKQQKISLESVWSDGHHMLVSKYI